MEARHLRENTSTVSVLYLNPETGMVGGRQDHRSAYLALWLFLKKRFGSLQL
jgi:hypothetical protein